MAVRVAGQMAAEVALHSARGTGTGTGNGTDLLARMGELTADLCGQRRLTPLNEAHLRLAEAELSRPPGTSSDLWAIAASHWERLESPYPMAYSFFRQAEALFAAGGKRRPATRLLCQARAGSARLQAAPLTAEIDALALRARLRLEAA